MIPSGTAYCVIGDPVEHSQSPLMHNHLFRMQDLPHRYEAVHVRSSELGPFIKAARKDMRPGINVTLPHKEAVIRCLDRVDGVAGRIGAVNTVKNESGKLAGYNTDVRGAERAIGAAGWKPGGLVLLLGAGGAARAVVEALAGLGARRLVIVDTNAARAERLGRDAVEWHGMDVTAGEPDPAVIRKAAGEASLLVNATPCGMLPRTDETPFPDTGLLPEDALVFDLVPNPLETRLLREAGAGKRKTLSGLPMLVEQAVAAQEIWLDRIFPRELRERMVREVTELVKQKLGAGSRYRPENGDNHGTAAVSHGG